MTTFESSEEVVVQFGAPVITREELKYAAQGFYRIKTRDRINKTSGAILHYGDVQWSQGQRYECDRVHVARVMPQECSRDFIGFEGLKVTVRPDGFKIVEGWCRADRLDIEAASV